ncbi:hypothetical protein PHLCEN_2v2551 [Hermanssonia centrifuga]|uniref:Uncharacterized protein n=1 Tax=Hermanssonia centrifuga TaxID=98765 RepID=A0A2R6RLM6_9APHY|nr:hypothetical protein PHLCEN_2v2551 [Hermanssonia centrifuga]
MSQPHPSGSRERSQPPPGDNNWDESLAYAQDDTAYRPNMNGSQDLYPPNTAALYAQQNRSVPNLAPQRQPNPDPRLDPIPPPPPYDATAALDSFGALHIGDPVPRGGSAMAYRQNPAEPIMRTGTSMSMYPTQSPQRLGPHPGAPHHQIPGGNFARVPQGRVPDSARYSDAMSVRSGRSGSSLYHSVRSDDSFSYDGHEADRRSAYSYEEPHGNYGNGGPDGPISPRRYPPPQGYQGQQQPYPQGPPPPNRQEYNPLYAAASDVLGMGPPPGAAPPGPYPPSAPNHMQHPQHVNYNHTGSSVSLAPSQSSAYMSQGPFPPNMSQGSFPPNMSQGSFPPNMAPSPYPPNAPAGYPAGPSLLRGTSVSSTGSGSSGGTQLSPMPPSIPEEREIEPRPSLQRSGTTASVTLRTQKTKAVDLSAPPYTKEYIDQYRQRIKDDPDPEAHFLYAKYLIDAARKVGADAKDQRSVKKYRDSLIAESLKVMRRLATQGQAHDEAQFFLANCHGTGMLGLQVDHERAYHLYLQAAKQNHAAACYRVAVCNEIGAGTRREPQRAAAFYRKAASLGDTAAMYKLGVILLRGTLGEQPNPREAVGWLKRAAEQADEENPHALHELAMLYEQPNSGVVPHDPLYAKELYARSGQLGYTHSQFRLGQCYEYGNLASPVDPKRSIAWYTKAAEKGHSEAELSLSGWYLTGSDGVLKQSDSEAYLWARRAANKGLSKAEYAVGYYAEVGIGVKQDVEFAKRWYMRAAAQGNKRAMNRLTEMKRSGAKRANIARPTRQDATNEECVIA